MTTTFVFEKSVSIKYDTINFPSDTSASLVRTFNDAVVDTSGNADPSQIAVFFNGAEIETTNTAKYYYAVSFSGSPVSSFTVTVYANQAYSAPGYSSTTCSFHATVSGNTLTVTSVS